MNLLESRLILLLLPSLFSTWGNSVHPSLCQPQLEVLKHKGIIKTKLRPYIYKRWHTKKNLKWAKGLILTNGIWWEDPSEAKTGQSGILKPLPAKITTLRRWHCSTILTSSPPNRGRFRFFYIRGTLRKPRTITLPTREFTSNIINLNLRPQPVSAALITSGSPRLNLRNKKQKAVKVT